MYEVCAALGISRSSYSHWLHSGKAAEEHRLGFYQSIIRVYSKTNGIYGAVKIAVELNNSGIECSSSTVSRAMRRLGIRSIVAERFPHKKSSLSAEEKSLIINLIKGMEIVRINQVWTTDITYIKTQVEGSFYLITYIDYFSKRVVAWDLRRRQRAVDMKEVLAKGVAARKPPAGLIIHSDKGSQMRSRLFRDYLSRNNFVPSYTSLNHSCDENAAQESFHALLKKECIYQHTPRDFAEAYAEIENYIDNFYNTVRIHSAIGYLSPVEFEKNL